MTLFETERLYCLPFTEEDFTLLYELHNHPDVAKSTADGPQSEAIIREQLNSFIQNHRERRYSQWKFFEKSTNAFLGRGGLDHKAFDPNSPPLPELRYALHSAYWGKGYASEIALGSVKYGFEVLALDKIVGTCYEDNIPSIKILEKTGMENVKTIVYKARNCPYYILTREAYETKR